MASKHSLWMERVHQLLADAPHPRAWVIAKASDLVPPGVAWRERELRRQWTANRDGRSMPEREVTDEAIRAGQTQVVAKYIWSAMRDGTLISFMQDGEVWLRKGEPKPYNNSPARIAASMRSIEIARSRNTVEKMREGQRKAMLNRTPESLREASLKANLSLSPEQRSERSRRAYAHMTPEQKAARIAKIRETMRRQQANMTPEQRAEVSRRMSEIRRAQRRNVE